MNVGKHNAKSRGRRAKWLAAASVPLVGLAAIGATVPAAYAAEFELLPPGPARVLTLSLLPGGNDDDLHGVMCQSPRTCQTVAYAYLFRPTGVANLDVALRDGTTGQQMIFAYSQGARVAALWLEEHEGTVGAPSPDDLSFVLMGNPGRKYGGADGDWNSTMPDTDYKILDVTREYDPASDFPDNPFNLLALLNANAGFLFTHQDYENVDIYDQANYFWKEGNTTYVFVPAENLPLLAPLRMLGLSGLADALNGPLKEIIDRAYKRDYLPATPGFPVTEPEPEPPATALASTMVSRTALNRSVDSIAADESQPADDEGQSDAIDEEVPSDVQDPAADDSEDDVVAEPVAEDETEVESDEDDKATMDDEQSSASTEDDSESTSDQDSSSDDGGSTDSGSDNSPESDE